MTMLINIFLIDKNVNRVIKQDLKSQGRYFLRCFNKFFCQLSNISFNVAKIILIQLKVIQLQKQNLSDLNMSKIYDTKHRFSETVYAPKYKGTLPPIHHHQSNIQHQKIQGDESMITLNKNLAQSRFSTNNDENYLDKPVPIYKISKITQHLDITLPIDLNKEKRYLYAKGHVCGSINSQYEINSHVSFHGHFTGTFQKVEENQGQVYYFQGKISKFVTINDPATQSESSSMESEELAINKQQQTEHKNVKGFFKGNFYTKSNHNEQDDMLLLRNQQKDTIDSMIKKKQGDPQYHVPALVTFDLRRITQINLQKSSANISATVKLQIQLNKDILEELYDFQKMAFKKKKKLNIDFHRGKPMILPFYDEDDFEDQQTDDEIEYEWGDVWEGIDLQVQWDIEKFRVKYTIDTIFTAQIDNSYGVCFSPFNLVVLKIVMDIHTVKLNKRKICINCCDLTDFNFDRPFTPYTQFSQLHRDQKGKTNAQIYKKHNDRRTKINLSYFMDQGQYRLANNRTSLFPYHKRVFLNKAKLTNNTAWLFGIPKRSELILKPQVRSVQQDYEHYLKTQQRDIFSIEQWEFMHLQIPIFKYPVIDMIRIFVPILILSTISLLIFVQENAKDGNGFTTLAKRIASGCSLMIAYVALVPMIRSNLPPTPSLTLVEVLIYISTIPNFLAIISNIFIGYIDYQDFFDNYHAFSDGLFISSFIISVVSFILLSIVMVVSSQKKYQSDFTIPKIAPATVQDVRAPYFTPYIHKVQQNRKDYVIKQCIEE